MQRKTNIGSNANVLRHVRRQILDWSNIKRISIIGPSGSGKSTLAVKLGQLLDLPVHHVDCYYLKQNWQHIGKDELAKQIKKVTQGSKWIIDGTYTVTLENRFACSDLVIYLNLPLDFCIETVKQRNEQKEKRIGLPKYLKPDNERLDELLIHLRTTPERYQKIPMLIARYKEKVIELKSRGEIDELVAALDSTSLTLL